MMWKIRAYICEVLISWALFIAPSDYESSIDLSYREGYEKGYKDQWLA